MARARARGGEGRRSECGFGSNAGVGVVAADASELFWGHHSPRAKRASSFRGLPEV